MIRRILPLALCLALVGLLAPGPVRAADGWSVSASTDLVQADFISTSGSQAQLYMEDHVSIEPFNIPEATAVLDALGFGGGYSQEVSWGSGGGPEVSCPKGPTDLFSFCSTDTSGGWALIPDDLRTELALSASASDSRTLDVRPSLRSLAYDATVAAIGIALETLSPGPIGPNATQVASLGIQLLPEAAGFEAAMGRKDYTTAGFELLSLSKRAMTIIADHITDWAIGSIVDLIPGLEEVKLGIAVSKAIVVLANLDTHLLAGYSVTTVTVGYGGGASEATTPAPNAGTFSPTGSMSTVRSNQTATLLSDGRVLIAGGEFIPPGQNTYTSLVSAELYDPTTGTFSPTGRMTTARGCHTATMLSDGQVLIAGGFGYDSVPLASAELYDPATGTFSPTGSMTTPRTCPTATRLADGRVLIVGGTGDASAELYDPATGTFSPTGSMTTIRNDGAATLLADGRVLFAGGDDDSMNPLASAELYSPNTGTFSPTGSMNAPRLFEAATLLSDGQVLITGGETPEAWSSAELYDPKTGRFGPTGSMTTSRNSPTASLLANGSVLIVGAAGTSAELYDPQTGTFSATGSMTVARDRPTATLLAAGRVLVAGGGTATAELYQPGGESGGTTAAPTPTSALATATVGGGSGGSSGISISPSTWSCSPPVAITETAQLPSSARVGDRFILTIDGQTAESITVGGPETVVQPDGSWAWVLNASVASVSVDCELANAGDFTLGFAPGTHKLQLLDSSGNVLAQGSYTVTP